MCVYLYKCVKFQEIFRKHSFKMFKPKVKTKLISENLLEKYSPQILKIIQIYMFKYYATLGKTVISNVLQSIEE